MIRLPNQTPPQGRAKLLTKYLIFRTAGILQRLENAGQTVLLTFDDGPNPYLTAAVLDRLRDANARAVFFCIGKRVRQYPGIVRRAIAEGHAIGNHTETHAHSGWLEVAGYQQEIRRCQEAIAAVTGQAPVLFRPPWGKTTPATLLAPRLLGLRSVYWSVEPRDYRLQTGAEAQECGAEFGEKVQAGDIVLLHDDALHILSLLDELLPRLRNRGFDLHSAAGTLS
jgi:peptidoglycan/xylan/chitin deacetylase (PgdA/CDA1 family)